MFYHIYFKDFPGIMRRMDIAELIAKSQLAKNRGCSEVNGKAYFFERYLPNQDVTNPGVTTGQQCMLSITAKKAGDKPLQLTQDPLKDMPEEQMPWIDAVIRCGEEDFKEREHYLMSNQTIILFNTYTF